MELMLSWIMLILAVVGACWLGGMLAVWWNRPRGTRRFWTVLPVQGVPEDGEQLLRYVRWAARWSAGTDQAVLLDVGLEPEARAILEELCRREPGAEVLDLEQLRHRFGISRVPR